MWLWLFIRKRLPILDTIKESDKYGNNGDKFDGISRTIVNGYEAFSNFLNTLIEVKTSSIYSHLISYHLYIHIYVYNTIRQVINSAIKNYYTSSDCSVCNTKSCILVQLYSFIVHILRTSILPDVIAGLKKVFFKPLNDSCARNFRLK